jgi:hypothetical protein
MRQIAVANELVEGGNGLLTAYFRDHWRRKLQNCRQGEVRLDKMASGELSNSNKLSRLSPGWSYPARAVGVVAVTFRLDRRQPMSETGAVLVRGTDGCHPDAPPWAAASTSKSPPTNINLVGGPALPYWAERVERRQPLGIAERPWPERRPHDRSPRAYRGVCPFDAV